MDAVKLRHITSRTLSAAVPGTSPRWWERRMSRLLALRDAEGRPLIVKAGGKYLGNLELLLDAILRGALTDEAP